MRKIRRFTSVLACFVLIASVFVVVDIPGLMCTQDVGAYDVEDDGQPVHEYIVGRAIGILPDEIDDEFNYYYYTIQQGARHEDLCDHVWDRSGAFTTINHFWDADLGPDDPVTGFGTTAHNAWQKAQIYWGMALGEYANEDKDTAYHFLGHVAHLLQDMSVPAHAHEDTHPDWDYDFFEVWMNTNYELSPEEKDDLKEAGPVSTQGWGNPLYFLFYTMNQIGDFFPSNDYNGDDIDKDEYGGWMSLIYTELGMDSITKPKYLNDIYIDPWTPNITALKVIRQYSYLYSIRATAGLFQLFVKITSQDIPLTVVIEEVMTLKGDDPSDYFVEVRINDFWFRNEGSQVIDNNHIHPHWAFGRDLGSTGLVKIVIRLWDEDNSPDDDDHSDIDPAEATPQYHRRNLDLWVDLGTGAITGDVTGTCGVTLDSSGDADDYSSQIWFRIIKPNYGPKPDAGPDKTVYEGEQVTLSGTFTDDNAGDTHSATWDWGDGSDSPGTVTDDTVTGSHTYSNHGVYTVTLTVTDNRGSIGTDTMTVTVNAVDYFNNRKYKLFATPKTWAEAKADCEARGGHLVTITSSDENDFVSNLAGSDKIWIGFTDEDKIFGDFNIKLNEGNWQWVTGEKKIYTNWYNYPEEPNDFGIGEDYAEMLSDGTWNDNGAPRIPSMTRYYICEWPEHGGIMYGGHEYKLFTTPKTWAESKAHCLSQGGHLVTISNSEENNFISNLAGSNRIWLGLTDEEIEDDWEWITGENYDYKNWYNYPVEPNDYGSGEDYAEMYGDGTWNDNGGPKDPYMTRYFVCEWPDDKYCVWVDDDFDPSTPRWGVTHFNKIQDGVDAVDVDGMVFVHRGTYNENVVIDRTLTLKGQDKDTTIIEGSGSGYGIYTNGISDITIKNLKIQGFPIGIYLDNSGGSTVTKNIVSVTTGYVSYGIWLRESDGSTISGNEVEGGESGIYLDNSGDSTVTGNTVSSIFNDIYVYYSGGSTVSENTVSEIRIRYSGGSTVSENTASSIHLHRSGSCTLTGNTVSSSQNGIYLFFSNGNTLIGNTVSSSQNGIYLYFSDGNTLTGNTVSSSQNGIYLLYSDGNTLTGNTVSGTNNGIYLYKSGSNILRDNVMADNTYNFYVDGDSLPHFIQDIDTSNTINGKPIYYIVDAHNLIIDGSTNAGYVGIVNSDHITVQDLTLTNNGQGVLFVNTYGSTIKNVDVFDNYHGIYLCHSNSNTISENTILVNTYAIYLWNSNSNTIFHNNFFDNTNQLYTQDSSNIWDDGAGKGNYWSDYTGLDDGSNGRVAGDGIGDTNLPYPYVDIGAISYWNLDEESGGTASDSVGVNHGDLEPSGPTWTTGQIDGALSFDGVNDYVQIDSPSNLPLGSSARTLEAWIYPTGGQGTHRHIAGYGTNSQKKLFDIKIDNDNSFALVGWGEPEGYDIISGSPSIILNNWYHVAATYDGNFMVKLYVNGNLVKTATIPYPYDTTLSGGGFTIGTNNNAKTNWPFKGLIDEVAIYNRALTVDEIQGHYNSGLTGLPISVFMGDYYPLISPKNSVHNLDTDEYFDTINDAINNANPGDSILMDRGRYFENVVIDKPLTLIGEDNKYTIIQGTGSGNGIYMNGQSDVTIQNLKVTGFDNGIRIENSNSITVSGITINNNGYGIKLSISDFITISNNNIFNNTIRGIQFYGTSNSLVKENTVERSGSVGIGIHTSDNVVIDDNNISYHSETGIKVENSLNTAITENTVAGAINGIDLRYSGDNTLVGNSFTEVTNAPISLSYSGGSTVTGNTITGSNYGIHVYRSDGCIVTQNTLIGAVSSIDLYQSGDNTLIGNTVTDSSDGIRLYSSGGCTLTENTVTTTDGSYGIHIYYSNGSTLTRNAVTGSTFGIKLLSSSGSMLTENTVTGSIYGINLIYSNGSAVTGNSVTDAHYAIRLDDTCSSTLAGNLITGAAAGITLDHSYGCTITDNTILGNEYSGFYLVYSESNNISRNLVMEGNNGFHLSHANNNSIYHNNIINNIKQVTNIYSTNSWDNGAGEGNYWSDYTGLDDGSNGRVAGDGVGDTEIPHLGVDDYPLTSPKSSVHNIDTDEYFDSINEATNNANPYDTIFVGFGRYFENVVIDKPLTLIGEDMERTVIQGTGSGNGIYIDGQSDVTVQNLKITGFKNGIVLLHSNNNIIRNNNLTSNSVHGLHLDHSDNNLICDNTASINNRGIHLGYSADNILSTNKISNNNYQGIALVFSDFNTITINNVANNSAGIWLSSSNGNNITDNIATNNNNGIFIVSYSNNNNIEDNTALGNYFMGISLDQSDNNIINNNTASNNQARGIHLGYSENNILSVNTISNNNYQGIALVFSNYNTVTINNVTNNSAGIWLSSSNSNNITDNIAVNNNNGIFLVSHSSNNFIDGNSALDNFFQGISLVQSDDNIISDNIASNNRASGILLRSSSNCIINDNTASRNNHSGILLDNTYSIMVTDNIASSNNGSGIYPWETYSSTISGNILENNIWEGITMWYSSDNIIFGNTILKNQYGFWMEESNNNDIFHNNVIDNTIQLHNYQSTNTWHNDGGEGNFWSDYTGLDDGSGGRVAYDGIGDTDLPHQSIDNYPLMMPVGFVYNVDKGTIYYDIQESINDADPGNTIKVSRGIYLENIFVDKPLTITGCKDKTVIQGTGSGIGLSIIGIDDVTIESLNFNNFHHGINLMNSENCVIKACYISDNQFGIFLTLSNFIIIESNVILNNMIGIVNFNSTSNTIESNTVSNNEFGIGLAFSIDNWVANNTISENVEGIYLLYAGLNYIYYNDISYNHIGIHLNFSDFNVIVGNSLSNNVFGIVDPFSNNNTISNNIITNNEYGIYIEDSQNNTITNNSISENDQGLYLDENSTDNEVYYNNFIENDVQAEDDGSNTWDDGAGSGNFWNDYTGEDSDGDGIGDTSHVYDDNPIIEPPSNAPPVVNIGGPYEVYESTEIVFDASDSVDYNDDDILQYRWDFNGDGEWDTDWSTEPTATFCWYDDFIGTAVIEVTDGEFIVKKETTVIVNNVAPSITSWDGPIYPVDLNVPIEMTGAFTDPGTSDTHTATIDWGDGTQTVAIISQNTISGIYSYSTIGVYKVTVTITDDNLGTASRDFRYIAIYDSTEGHVTGGGWIGSPEGAYTPDPTLTGKASFGFVAKYKKGTTEPIGKTEFQFHAAGMNFHSSNYEWLVVAGSKAMFKGTGTINGEGEYKFILTAVDGDLKGKDGGPDKFRIKIWVEDEETGEEIIIYDNMLGAEVDEELDETTELGGGAIVIHKG